MPEVLAAARALRPELVPGEVGGAAVGGRRVQRVTAVVVDPRQRREMLVGRECGRHIAQAHEGVTGLVIPRPEPGARDVDGAVVRRPRRRPDIERLLAGAVVEVALRRITVATVEARRRPAGNRGMRPASQIEHENLAALLPAGCGEVALDAIERAAVAHLLV